MASRELWKDSALVGRWTNEGTAGYYSGSPLARQRALTAQEAADLAAQDAQAVQATNAATIDDYLTVRRARLTTIRTQAQAVSAKAAIAAGLNLANLNTQLIAVQTDLKTLAAAIDDLAQYDIRLGRRLLAQTDATDA